MDRGGDEWQRHSGRPGSPRKRVSDPWSPRNRASDPWGGLAGWFSGVEPPPGPDRWVNTPRLRNTRRLPERQGSVVSSEAVRVARDSRPRRKACGEPFTSAAPCAMLWPVTAYAAESTDSESPLERLARRGWWFLLIFGIVASRHRRRSPCLAEPDATGRRRTVRHLPTGQRRDRDPARVRARYARRRSLPECADRCAVHPPRASLLPRCGGIHPAVGALDRLQLADHRNQPQPSPPPLLHTFPTVAGRSPVESSSPSAESSSSSRRLTRSSRWRCSPASG